MGRGDRRRSLKMIRSRNLAKKKARLARQAEAKKAERKDGKK